MNKLSVLLLMLASLPLSAASHEPTSIIAPELLHFDELVTLSNSDQPAEPLAAKLDNLLNTPFLLNKAELDGVRPHRPVVNGIGPVLRVVSWNIERGLNFDLIRLALSDPEAFKQAALERGPLSKVIMTKLEQQVTYLRDADIVVLNEVDLGMKRTGYRDVSKELARALGMNYVFGVEFVEVDRLDDLGIETFPLEDPALTRQMADDLAPDPSQYLGLHGNAILSRYPIHNARIFRLPTCHDWYNAEKAEISKLEKGKRLAANKVFLERIQRQVRRGGRMAIIAEVGIPELPGGLATVVDVHLENKCKPECRTRQMDALLSRIQEVDGPVIIAGDLNTTGFDGTPTSIRREILKRVKNYEFWVTQGLKWGTPAALPLAALTPVKYYKSYLDPTSTHVPVIGSNKEAILFRHVERFRFADRNAFDFRGDEEHNLYRKSGTLANSNQRARKGFEPTFTLKRDFGGLVGRYKLDWFFVKPYIPQPRGSGMSYRFAPHFPLTLRDLNNSVPDGISDHAPIAIDLPYGSLPYPRRRGPHADRKAQRKQADKSYKWQ